MADINCPACGTLLVRTEDIFKCLSCGHRDRVRYVTADYIERLEAVVRAGDILIANYGGIPDLDHHDPIYDNLLGESWIDRNNKLKTAYDTARSRVNLPAAPESSTDKEQT